MARTVFFGFGAFVGAIKGPTQIEWWADDPAMSGFAATALIPVDLARNPSAARAGTIAVGAIEVDDHRVDGGLTTVGPRFPLGATVGALWLSQSYYVSLGGRQPPRHPAAAAGDAYDHELTAVQCWGELGDRKFLGFHAKIVSTNGGLALVEIWHGGTGKRGGPPAGRWWLDLAAVALPFDAADPAATQIALRGPAEGALFLDATTTGQIHLLGPKRPPSSGDELHGAPAAVTARERRRRRRTGRPC